MGVWHALRLFLFLGEMQRTLLSSFAKIVGAVIYSVTVALLAMYALRTIKSEGGGTRHTESIRSLIVQPCATDRLSSIGGLSEVKKELKRWVLLPLRYPEVYFAQSTLRPSMGVLLHGPPGTGKTMLARAVASESNVPFIALHSAALESKWWGESPKLLNAAFTLARKELSPCIIFFDEIDSLGRTRSEMDQSCVYSFKCELLRNIDGIEDSSQTPVIVMACTNCVQSLDPALRRRFGRVIRIGRPSENERYDILKKLTRKEQKVCCATLRRVAAASDGMTGAELTALYSEATMSRMDKTDVETKIESGVIKSGEDLIHHLGDLTWDHWASGGRLAATATRGK